MAHILRFKLGRRKRDGEDQRSHLQRLSRDACNCGLADEMLELLDRVDALEGRLTALENGGADSRS